MDSHEPMTLGSPASPASPVTSTGGIHQHSSGQYLPGFLMGDANVGKASVLSRSVSAGGPSHSYLNSPTFGSNSLKSSPPSATLSPGNKFGHMIRSRVNVPSAVSQKEKAGAPPVSSLTDDDNQSFYSPSYNSHMSNRSGVTEILGRTSSAGRVDSLTPKSRRTGHPPRTIVQSTEHDVPPVRTPPSPAQIDPFYAQGEALNSSVQLDDTWVTVFGFPPTASSYILQQFSKCGVILEHCSAPDEGNWINIRFESKLQARKALSKSGKILPGNLMIGVSPCIDLKVLSKRDDIDTVREAIQQDTSILTPITPGVYSSNTPRSAVNSPKPCTIRPLTAAYNAASSGSKVTSDVRTPQKTSGIITKAMDYIFG